MDLSKPLVSRVRVGKFIQVIEYEAMHTVCFGCGVYGHRIEKCPLRVKAVEETATADACTAKGGESRPVVEETTENFGPWMLVQRKPLRDSNLKGKNIVSDTNLNDNPDFGGSNTNSFGVLSGEDSGLMDIPEGSKNVRWRVCWRLLRNLLKRGRQLINVGQLLGESVMLLEAVGGAVQKNLSKGNRAQPISNAKQMAQVVLNQKQPRVVDQMTLA